VRVPRPSILAAGLVTLIVLVPEAAPAQAVMTRLTVSGLPMVMPAPTGTDFVNGSIESAPISYLVEAIGGPVFSPRSTSVSIRCALPCPTSGTKAMASLQWRRGDLGAWSPISTGDVLVEQRWMVMDLFNDPWTNTILFRFLLDWSTDPPGSSGEFNLVLTLTVVAP
jgi:hypothetical protein